MLKYATIERQLAEALPEIQPAAHYYWKTDGEEGKDAGPYVFFESMFGCYVEILLAMPASSGRSRLLRRAFGFERKCSGAQIEKFRISPTSDCMKGRPGWWLRRAVEYIGARGKAVLDEFDAGWRQIAQSEETVSGQFIDLYGVRQVIATELQREGVGVPEIPGSTHVGERPY